MEFQRVILWVSLAFILMLIYQAWVEDQQPAPGLPGTGPAVSTPGNQSVPGTADLPAAPATPEGPAGDVPAAPTTPVTAATPAAATVKVLDRSEGQRIVVTTDLLRAEIDPLGGDLRNVDLLAYPEEVDSPELPFRLMSDQGDKIFTSQTGLIGRGVELPTHKTLYQAEALQYKLAEGRDKIEVPLTWVGPDGSQYTKVLIFYRDSYQIDIEYRVTNRSAKPLGAYLYAQFLRSEHVPDRGFLMGQLPSYTGAAIYTPEEHYEKIDFDDMREAALARTVKNGWVAMLQHYFVAALLPAPAGDYQFYSQVVGNGSPLFNIGYKTLRPVTLAPGESGKIATRLYVGPKEQQRIKQQAEGLVLTVDYGWLTPVAQPLFWVLEYIYSVVGNWGWAIILLTLLIKIVFYPLSAASYKSMAKMKKLQPRMKTLKERYADDKQKFQQAMMEIYKKEKVNPMGGCLPILIQIPVFIALYWVLLESVELRQADFALWLNDLSAPDPYFVLPLLMGASMFVQQMLNPAPPDPTQQKIMMALPVVFTVMFLFFPAGLVLYWVVNNILSISQQWYITQAIQKKDA